MRNRIAHQKKLAAILLVHLQRCLCRGYRASLQLADLLRGDGLPIRQFQSKGSALGPQRTSSCCHTDLFQMDLQLSFQPFRHDARQIRHLLDVVNLPIHHGTAFMLFHFDAQNLEPVSHGPSHNAHHAACANVQSEHEIGILRLIFRHTGNAPSFWPHR